MADLDTIPCVYFVNVYIFESNINHRAMGRSIIIIAFISSTFLFYQCDTGKPADEVSAKYKIAEMPNILEKQAETKKISATEGGSILYSNGTQIIIPPNALICEGKPVTDSVEVSYVQYDSPLEIYSSGIPMQYDSAGESYTFKSAGMFALKADLNGKEVSLASGETIDVKMPSKIDDPTFSLYYFDTVKGQWENKGKDSVVDIPIVNEADILNSIASLTRSSSEKVLQNKFTGRNDVIPIIIHDLERFPIFKVFSSTAFEIITDDIDLQNKATSNNWIEMQFDTSMIEDKTTLTLVNSFEKINIEGKIILDGEYYKDAMQKYPQKKAAYDERIRVRDSLQRILLLQRSCKAIVSREFNISGFGIWNCDAPLLKDGIPVELNLQCKNASILNEVGVAYINQNSVYRTYINAKGTYNCKLLDTKHLIYASDTTGNIYIGIISQRKATSCNTNERLDIRLKRIKYPRLFFEDLKNQINDEIEVIEENETEETYNSQTNMSKEFIETNDISINLYPIPAVNFVKINITETADDLKISIINSRGEQVKTINNYSPLDEIDISDLKSGFYIVKVRSKALKFVKTENLLVQKKS